MKVNAKMNKLKLGSGFTDIVQVQFIVGFFSH